MGAKDHVERYKRHSWDCTDRYWRINRRGRELPEACHWKVIPQSESALHLGTSDNLETGGYEREGTNNSIQTEQRGLRDNCWDWLATGVDPSSLSRDWLQWLPTRA